MIAEAGSYIDFAKRRVVYGEDDFLCLSPQETIVLRRLARRPGKPVSTERLLAALYSGARNGGPEQPENVLRVLVYRLRRVLPWPILSRYGGGYWIEGYTAAAEDC